MILGVHRIAHQHWTRCVDLAGGVFPASLSPGFQLRHSVARISLTDLADMPIVSLPCEHYCICRLPNTMSMGQSHDHSIQLVK